MFMFKWCMESKPQLGYQISNVDKSKNQGKFFSDVDDFEKHLHNDNVTLKKIRKANYNELVDEYKGTTKKWTDPEFPPGSSSLGKCEGVKPNAKWKRISEILTRPVLFDCIEPMDVMQGNLGDCYFLSAVAALAEQKWRIMEIFGSQTKTNENGIYKINLSLNGEIREYVVDDYIPVNDHDEPLFCQMHNSQFWVLILEKAWAKANGSYANVVAGLPSQVFRAFTLSPVRTFDIQKPTVDKKDTWKHLMEGGIYNLPMCAGTFSEEAMCRAKGLQPSHAYTLLDANQCTDLNGKSHQIVRLRNPWGKGQWNGFGSDNDNFWKTLSKEQKKKLGYDETDLTDDGIFFMNYQNFLTYFDVLDICYNFKQSSYFYEQVFAGKLPSLFEFTIGEKQIKRNLKIMKNRGPGTLAFFELHQPTLRGQSEARIQEGLCKSTLLVAKKLGPNQYKLVGSKMVKDSPELTLPLVIQVGTYVVWSLYDATSKGSYPTQSNFSIYSDTKIQLKNTTEKSHPQLLRSVFLEHAKSNPEKQKVYNNQMWIARKLMYAQGGFAYIAFGNEPDTRKKFQISMLESDFNKIGFEWFEPYKGKGKLLFQVFPGKQQIVVCRLINNFVSTGKIVFPPDVNIQLRDL